MSRFYTYVHTAAGLPIPNTAIKVTIAANEVDVTTTLFGISNPVTGADGKYIIEFLPTALSAGEPTGPLATGNYYFRFSAPGYEVYETITTNTFTGVGESDITLVPLPVVDQTEIPDAPYRYVSPLFATVFEIPANAQSPAWELIEGTLTDDASRTRVMRVPAVAGFGALNIQARLNLKPIIHLVPVGALGLVDQDFSGTYTLTARSITASGTTAYAGQSPFQAALIRPSGTTNDLTDYTNQSAPAKWITPWAAVPKRQGHYADVMVWLTVALTGSYFLRVAYQNINRAEITQTTTQLDSALFTAKKAVRIKIPEPIDGAYYATMSIEQGATTLTTALPIRYIHG